jgi:hypothetical protein
MGDTGVPSRKLLTRKEAAAYISAAYFKVTARTLAVWASSDKGPPYRLLAGQAHYTRKDIDDWLDKPDHDGIVTPTRLNQPSGALGMLPRK